MASSPRPDASQHLLDLFMPLEFFYSSKADNLPAAELLQGFEVPEPYRHLLVHESDMTPRLRRFHDTAIGLRVIEKQVSEDYVMRLVVLHRMDNGAPVEMGAIGIQLDGFAPELREEILAGRIPLGGLLEAAEIVHESSPKAYFAMLADAFLADLLGVKVGTKVYGRCNALSHSGGIVFADIVEILPPVPSHG
jgi:chorismate-pyruvate lyase